MATTLETKLKNYSVFLPFIQSLVDIHQPTLVFVRCEGIRAVSFRAMFSTAISSTLRLYFDQGKTDKYNTLREWWNNWKTRMDKQQELAGTVVLSTKGFVTGEMFEVSYTHGIGFGVLRPAGATAAASLPPNLSLIQPDIERYDQPYDDEVFKAFFLLKAKERISHSVVLRGISLEELQSRFGQLIEDCPQNFVIEEDQSSIVIL